MAAGIRVTITGADDVHRSLNAQRTIRGPIRDFLERSARTVEGEAKRRVVVDTGRLRSSIASDVNDKRAVVGTNVKYAPYIEFGTRPHFPPLSALQPWARRHGFPAGARGAFLVAQKIAARGTQARPFLLPALNHSRRAIQGFADRMGREIERRWRSF